jgi:hypothetical protein
MSYFSRLFKKETGMLPTAFKNQFLKVLVVVAIDVMGLEVMTYEIVGVEMYTTADAALGQPP